MDFTRITVIGAGAWGTTMAHLVSHQARSVVIWTDNQAVCESIQTTRRNAQYLPDIHLKEHVEVTTDVQRAADECKLFLCAIPVQFMRMRLRAFAPFISRGSIGISLSKGIETGTFCRPSQIFMSEWDHLATSGSLIGANIAAEVAAGGFAEASLALTTLSHAAELQTALATDRFRISTTMDVTGAELSAALKNVIAIAAGVCDGLETGYNTKSLVITRGLHDLRCLTATLGGNPDSALSSSALGDLLATCFSPLSRNRRFGECVGRGMTLNQAASALRGRIAEGVATCSVCQEMINRLNITLPVFSAIYQTLYRGHPATHCLEKLLFK